jgi:hypothetical protein
MDVGHAGADSRGGKATAGSAAPQIHDPRPTTHDPRPTTHDPRPTTHDPRPTTHDMDPTLLDGVAGREPEPMANLVAAERVAELRRIASLLPEPRGHILLWRAIHGWTYARVHGELTRHRSVSLDWVMTMGQQAVAMAALAAAGGDPAAKWPGRYRRGKIPPHSPPLPPLASL